MVATLMFNELTLEGEFDDDPILKWGKVLGYQFFSFFYSIFDLQSCQPDNLVDGLLEDVPLGDLDTQNENARSKNRATSLFSIFTQREVIQ